MRDYERYMYKLAYSSPQLSPDILYFSVPRCCGAPNYTLT